MIGDKFGRLTVLHNPHNKRVLVQCECGKKKIVRRADLRDGKVKSCGCLCDEKVTKRVVAASTLPPIKPGQRFGRLVALSKVKQPGEAMWLCRCDCGNERAILGYNLKSGRTKGCGCQSNNRSLYQ